MRPALQLCSQEGMRSSRNFRNAKDYNCPGSGKMSSEPMTTTLPRESRPSISASSVETMLLWIWSCLLLRTCAHNMCN